MFADHHRALRLVGSHTLTAQRTLFALMTPPEAITDFSRLLLHQSSALSTGLSRRTNRPSLFDLNVKILCREAASSIGGRWLGWPHEFAAFGFDFGQPLGRHISPIDILHGGFLQT